MCCTPHVLCTAAVALGGGSHDASLLAPCNWPGMKGHNTQWQLLHCRSKLAACGMRTRVISLARSVRQLAAPLPPVPLHASLPHRFLRNTRPQLGHKSSHSLPQTPTVPCKQPYELRQPSGGRLPPAPGCEGPRAAIRCAQGDGASLRPPAALDAPLQTCRPAAAAASSRVHVGCSHTSAPVLCRPVLPNA